MARPHRSRWRSPRKSRCAACVTRGPEAGRLGLVAEESDDGSAEASEIIGLVDQ